MSTPPLRRSLIWIAAFSVATNVLMIVPPLHMLQVYDRVLASNSVETLIYITAIALVFMVLYGIAEAVRGKLAQRAAARYTLASADPLFADLANGGDGPQASAAALRDFNTVRAFLASRALPGLFDLPFVPFFLLLMFMLHWSLGALTFVGLAVLVGIALANRTMMGKVSAAARDGETGAMSFAQAVFMRGEDIRAMGLLPGIMARWGRDMGTAMRDADVAARAGAGWYGGSKAARKALQVVIMAWGAWLVIDGHVSGGVIFAASMISGRALQPIEQVIGGWDRIVQARGAHARIDTRLADGVREEPMRLPKPKGVLSLDDISFTPPGAPRAVLENVTLTVKPGEIVAIVGPSGAGKSTLARLMAGAATPDMGAVRLDGAERSQWPADQWGEGVGYVAQDIALFPVSLAQNIARLAETPDEKAVVASAQAVGIHDMILGLPQGYATPIGTVGGDDGVRLSGGQKQRVALARALYTDPAVLVLDEPNAHLDAAGEQALMATMKGAKAAGRTVVIVTQRRSVLAVADRVFTVSGGRVVEGLPQAQRQQVKAPSIMTPEPAREGVQA